MIENTLDLQQAIQIIENKIHPKYLNRVQEIILSKSLEGQTYSQIAAEYNYGMEYIKTSGYELWRLLSQAFGEQVTKSNCSSFIRRQILEFSLDQTPPKKQKETQKLILTEQEANSVSTITPEVSSFQGRGLELAQLINWINDLHCRFILITGMAGCGKTALATKAVEMVKNSFYKVIFLSINNNFSLKDFLEFCLRSLDSNLDTNKDTNKLLVDLTLYLQKYRCLLILDDLNSIVEFKKMVTYYRSDYQEYAQFLRCLITTNHNSLIIATSNIFITQLSYYSSKRVKTLQLKGLKREVILSIFGKNKIVQDIPLDTWERICNYYQNNPELIKIAVRNFNYLPMFDSNIYQEYYPYIEEIDCIIEGELQCLDDLSREVVYWLAFNFETNNLKQLFHSINCPRNKILKVLDFLEKHSLIKSNGQNYILKSIYRDYVQRHLVKVATKKIDNR